MTGSNPTNDAAHGTTRVRPFGDEAVAEAAALIAAGQLVAVPTETVYGLAADATRGESVAAIYAAKGRPGFNPLIVHVADWAMAQTFGEFSPLAARLARAFWPGPLTIVVPRTPGCPIASIATAGLATIALRCPAHPAMQALIRASGRPLAAPSANVSGTVSPTTAAHVLSSLRGRVPMIIDDGACIMGLESTIIAVDGDEDAGDDGESAGRLTLLRPGPVTAEMLAAACGIDTSRVTLASGGAIIAPGQMTSHYAPGKPVLLDCTAPPADAFTINFGAGGFVAVDGDYQLSASADLVEAAARLFDALHAGAASALPRIAIAPIPHHGLGVAINDRLRRAAA